MTMPGRDNLQVERAKLADYLLSPTNPRGRHKAIFFSQFGYTADNLEEFAEALRVHGRTQEVIRIVDTIFGRRCNVEGPITTPDGRNPRIRTVWQVDPGRVAPRLISAHPRRT